MGVSFQMDVFVGVVVDPQWVWDERTYTPSWCGHSKSEGSVFCPTCGLPKPDSRTVKSPSSELLRLLQEKEGIPDEDRAEDAFYERPFRDLLSGILVVTLFQDQLAGDAVFLAGVPLAHFNSDGRQPAHKQSPLPDLPRQEEIEQALDEAGIPYLKDSYGLHKMCMGW